MAGRNQGDLRPLLRKIRKLGFSLETTSGGHLRVTAPSGDFTITSATPGSAKAIYRLRSWLRHQGCEMRSCA